VGVQELDFNIPLEAHAYISEKSFYLRANIVENFPELAYAILTSKLENAPEVTPAFILQNRETIEAIVGAWLNTEKEEVRAYFRPRPREGLVNLAGRLFAFDNTRAMLDISRVFPLHRIFANPMQPTKLSDVFLIKRNFNQDTVIETLSLGTFMERLLIGETPDGGREIAYNAYRAVDDETEQGCIRAMEMRAAQTNESLYEAYRQSGDIPETLREEFELFRMMHQATKCYDLNTILQKDPTVQHKREAVERTLRLIVRAVEEKPNNLHCTLSDYTSFIEKPITN
jgi:hypothetical protein